MNMQIVDLTDPSDGSRARVLADFGFNCFSYQPMVGSVPTEVLWAHREFTSGEQRPSGSGIPLLFPFAGRIRGTRFAFAGRAYDLEEGDGQGNAIHGFVMNRRWRVTEQSESSVTGCFQASVDDSDLLKRWPADFRIQVTYRLNQGRLECDVAVDNPSDVVLPCGFATHAYFRLPLGGSGEAGDTMLQVPAGKGWELVGLVPTGNEIELGDLAALSEGLQLGERQLDNALGDVRFDEGGLGTTTIRNPANGLALRQTFDRNFRHVVVYTPPHREAVCIEPYTTLPNPFELEGRGIRTGLMKLDPGERWQTSLVLAVNGEG